MNISHPKRLIVSATLVAAASTGIGLAATSSYGSTPKPTGPASTSPTHPWTPDDCIRLNGGDYNACNVGNSGRGDLPYRPVAPAHAPSYQLPRHLVRVE